MEKKYSFFFSVKLEFTIQLSPVMHHLSQDSSYFPQIEALSHWQFINSNSHFQVFWDHRRRTTGLSHIHCHQLTINTRLKKKKKLDSLSFHESTSLFSLVWPIWSEQNIRFLPKWRLRFKQERTPGFNDLGNWESSF